MSQETHIDLNDGWQFKQEGTEVWHDAEVPGLVHTDLMRHGLIPDPYLDLNVDSVQWIEHVGWTYKRTIEADEELLSRANIDLVFKGLDTFSRVYLNGVELGSTDNMFREWRWPVKPMLRIGSNDLEIRFLSPIKEGVKRREAYGIQLPHDSDPSGVAPYVRKAAYHFGWDFAPRLVSCGIWQDVEMVSWGAHRLTHLYIDQQWTEDDLRVVVRANIYPTPIHSDGLRMVVILDGVEMASTKVDDENFGSAGAEFMLERPERWWPSGSGEQPVHELLVELRSEGMVLSAIKKHVGWRTVELDRAVDSIGSAYTFVVNGRPIFMKGCNLVPPDMFLPRAGDEAWVKLVADMAEANMNMVRVWGGGVYPPDAFFLACDTAGIMVWQDLMFAYMTPYDDYSQRSIIAEVTHQLARFAHHPSMAIICGNNELDVAWGNWGWQERYQLHGEDSTRVWNDQLALFHGPDVRTPVEELHLLPYVPTSPLSNWGNDEGLGNGSLHYWGVWHGDSTFASYRGNVGRFVSEYGFQSWPDSTVLARYINPLSLQLGSDALKRRQGSYRGEGPIKAAMVNELGHVPGSFSEYCKASQLVQSLAYISAISAHLEARPRCMGTLLWQLNDVWPAPSWSIIDWDGNRKPAYYQVKSLYAGSP